MTKQEAAMMVLGNVELPNRTPQLDPVLVSIITQLLEWAIPKCAAWITTKTATSTPQPGIIKMMMLRKKTKQAFVSSGKGIADFRTHGEAVIQGLLKTYKNATPDQVNSLVQGA